VPAQGRAAIVDETDPYALELDRGPNGKRPAERAVVHIPLDGRHGAEPAEVGEHGGCCEVASVDDRVGRLEDSQGVGRKRARAAR
jgi:hypothetical protein